jgi:hypothetical protein
MRYNIDDTKNYTGFKGICDDYYEIKDIFDNTVSTINDIVVTKDYADNAIIGYIH